MLILAAAHAACGDDLPAARAQQSVVWISPLRKRVGANTRVSVVPVADLKAFAKRTPLTTARLLQLVGARKSHKAPKRPWKVTVFDASSGALCRPIALDIGTDVLEGVAVCQTKPSAKETGCGRTRDRESGGDGLPMFRARWRDLAPQGFCVLPVDRFAAEL